jgi:hypothetical protein
VLRIRQSDFEQQFSLGIGADGRATEWLRSVDICCPQCGRLYHADESHLGKSIKCVQCGKILLLTVGEPPAPERERSAVREVHFGPRSRGPESGSFQSTARAVRARSTRSLGWFVRGLNKPQRFVVALATFAFLITAVGPPFVIGRGVRCRWLAAKPLYAPPKHQPLARAPASAGDAGGVCL